MYLHRKLFLLLRIQHWSKGVFVLLGVIYAAKLDYWFSALVASLAFCIISSAVYIYNDLQDIEEDKAHPKKSRRPLASEAVSIAFALRTLVFLLLTGLLLGLVVSAKLAEILIVYLLINIFYNHWLRQVPLFDVLCIASGFMLRIFAGTVGIGLPISWWLVITATLLSLFIALCKRRLELQLGLTHIGRAVLKRYHPQVLDLLIVGTASGCFLSYLLYTVYVREEVISFFFTLPFCAIGLWRFTALTTKDNQTDDPIALFFSDTMSRLNLLCFFTLTLMAIWR